MTTLEEWLVETARMSPLDRICWLCEEYKNLYGEFPQWLGISATTYTRLFRNRHEPLPFYLKAVHVYGSPDCTDYLRVGSFNSSAVLYV